MVLPAGHWDPAREVDRLVADHDGRFRRRVLMQGTRGLEFLLDLETARHLYEGDGLLLPDGAIVRVTAAHEALLEIRATSMTLLLQLAWHLGNRHLAASIETDRILIRNDHVIAAMVRRLGGLVQEIDAPFDPQSGAYHEQDSRTVHSHADGHHEHGGHGHTHDH
ncbi:MAG: urease accessory protein UreE [Janthinobacterium lividum]